MKMGSCFCPTFVSSSDDEKLVRVPQIYNKKHSILPLTFSFKVIMTKLYFIFNWSLDPTDFTGAVFTYAEFMY